MATREQLETALRNADAAGDVEAARRLATALRTGQFKAPQPAAEGEIPSLSEQTVPAPGSPTETMRAVAEPLAAVTTGALGELGGGLTYLGTLAATLGDTEAAEYVRQKTAEAFTYDPRTPEGRKSLEALSRDLQPLAELGKRISEASGEAGYQAAGPVGGAVGYVAPQAVAELTAFRAPGRIGTRLGVSRGTATRRAEAAEQQAADLQAEVDAQAAGRPTTEGVEQVAGELSKKRPDVAEMAEFDPAIIKAAQELGFEEIPPSVAAGNSQFRAIAQGLASITGSKAEAQYGEFLESLANKADEIIQEGGGSLDKPAVSMRYRDESNRIIDNLSKEEGRLYDEIRDAVNPSEKVDVAPLRQYLDAKVEEFGGIGGLPGELKRLYRLAYQKRGDTWVERYPTYAAFDLARREIGQAIGKKSGAFADAESRLLSEMYGATKDAQRAIVERAGAGQLQDAADALTIKRKAVEDTMIDALGKDLSKDLMPQVAAKITGLPKGNVTKFNQFIEGIPEKMRKEVVVSALNDLLRGTGADQKGMGAARFTGFMNDLNRSPTAKQALYKYLPKETRRSLNNLGKVAAAIHRANKDTIKTGKIAQLFPDNRKWLMRMMGALKGAMSVKAGPAGSVAVDSVAEFLSNTTPKARTANEFIASPAFQDVIKSAVRDGVVQGEAMSRKTRRLEELAERSRKYREWADTLEGSAKARLASVGLVNYLLDPTDSEDQ